MHSNLKKQKTLLRITKRMVTIDKNNLEIFKVIGQNFLNKIKILRHSAK